MYRKQAGRQRGVTFIELILFIVIVGGAVVGILQIFSLTAKNSADPLRRKQALMLAEGLLEEVQLAKFTFCDPTSDNVETATSPAMCSIPENFGQNAPEPSNPRPYDNINDYVAAPNVPTAAFNDGAGNLVDGNGNSMNINGYTARLTIVPENLGTIVAVTPDGPEVLRITVEVSYDGDQRVVLDGYRTRYAPNFP